MAIFDFRGQDGREVIAEAYHLAAYTSGMSVLGESLGFLFNDPSTDVGTLPEGWREVTFEELGIDLSHANTESTTNVGEVPYFDAEGLLDGDAKVLAKVDADGNIIQLAIVFSGTNSIEDIIDFTQLANLTYADGFEYLFEAVRDLAVANGLTGEDVLFTGYSLGGGATNLAFLNRADYADGFFANSDYIAFASPVVLDDSSENLFNFGFENDVVYRAGGSNVEDPPTLIEVLANGTDDIETQSSLDNLVLFNDSYALDAFPYGDFNLLNLFGWLAHLDGGVAATRLFDTIASSNFYDKMEQDSTIIVSNLDLLRDVVWVEPVDRATGNHVGEDSFILGSEHDDLLGDSTGNDFLDGFAGNDEFRISEGNDTVHGGAGTDTVNMNGSLNEYEIIRLSDGTTYFYDTEGRYGLEELIQVEEVDFGFAQTYSLDASGVKWGPFEVANYDAASEGSDGADTLSGGTGRDRIFGQDGNDTLAGAGGNDLLHGGEGADTLDGGAGDDQLYGAAGNDVLSGGAGNDTLSGGLGTDIFTFGSGWGDDIITDYNMGEQGDDLLEFSLSVFASFDEVRNAAVQSGDDVVIGNGTDSLTLYDTTIADLNANDFLFV